MEINCKEIRESARISLKGTWKVAILSTLMLSIASFIQNFTQMFNAKLFVILSISFSALIMFGYTAIILHIVRGEEAEFLEIFAEYKRFLKALGIIILMRIYITLWSLLLVVPGMIAVIKYSMTFYIWVDNPDIGVNEAIRKSIEMTNGYKWDIFRLGLSFIGWNILVSIPMWAVLFWDIQHNGSTFMQACMSISHYAIHPAVIISSIGVIFVNTYKNVSMGKLYSKLVSR